MTTPAHRCVATPPHAVPTVLSAPLSGKQQITPFLPDGPIGEIEADGQCVLVTALAINQANEVIFLSLVGRDTSSSAVLAQLWQGKQLPLSVRKPHLWPPSPHVQRCKELTYTSITSTLPTSKMVHTITMPHTGHIQEGLLHPPTTVSPPPHHAEHRVPVSKERFLFANWDEEEPHSSSFFGHLHAMRIVVLYRGEAELREHWAAELWRRGLRRSLILPCPSLGIRAWRIEPDVLAWNALIGQGVRDGWLPWR
ncbi:hypothetical protein EI42_03106 [Thermosporothrix hazakensis]|jgi:hypothetical protein|uniref:Uncharacterized protein n=1 Tax=Thermosporothrix hazakensis TaxID=644383 RepID=A0A326U515_THEHA|nr:hypothetical protein [Thermosporothrix hazakensis]PZW28352.1 hypothetical protein EI42_03106 [Thermosporothrix hazakensis]GCE46289.1 hypothetical protein KTH_11580 [Thermosporothrix hazakensis]